MNAPTPLRPAPSPEIADAADPKVVAVCAMLLRQAQEGRLRAVAFAGVLLNECHEPKANTGFEIGAADVAQVLGASTYLQFRLSAHLDRACGPGEDPRPRIA
jgi:hypothetical protein